MNEFALAALSYIWSAEHGAIPAEQVAAGMAVLGLDEAGTIGLSRVESVTAEGATAGRRVLTTTSEIVCPVESRIARS